jgi:cytochrome c553
MIIRSRVAVVLLAACSLSTNSVLAREAITTAPLNSVERHALNPPHEMLDHGKNVAETACASCHGVSGIGVEPGTPNLAGQRLVYLYRVLQGYQDHSRRSDTMNHAVGFLNEAALLAVAAWYASQPPARPEPVAEAGPDVDLGGGDPFAGLRDAMKKCIRCHGEDGNASASGMPNLTGQSVEYFVHSMQAYVEGGRDHRLMSRLAEGLDDATLERMGVFYAVQEPVRTTTLGDGNADRGRELAEPCAVCHGADGNAAGADMPTLAGQDARYFTKAMEAYRDGSRQQEAMFEAAEPLDDTGIADLAAYYAMQNPVRRNVRAPLTTSEWIDRCARCHGVDGNSTDPRFPMLAGQDRTYLANALRAYLDNTRSSTAMHAMSAPLSEPDLQRIVDYYASREPRSVVYMVLPCEETTDE